MSEQAGIFRIDAGDGAAAPKVQSSAA